MRDRQSETKKPVSVARLS